MSAQPIDYAALAQQAGAMSSQPAPSGPALVKPPASKIDYAALAKQAGATKSDPPPDSSPSLDWSQVVKNLPGSLSNFVKSINQGLGPTGANWSPDQLKYFQDADAAEKAGKPAPEVPPPSGRFSQAYPDVAKSHPTIASAADSLEELVHNVTNPKEFFEKDPVGAVQTYGNLARGGVAALGAAVPAVADATKAVAEGAKGAATGAAKGAVAPTELSGRFRGIPFSVGTKVPASVSGGVSGGIAGHYLAGTAGMAVGATVGAAVPIIKGGIQGAREALANLAAKRAAAADALSAVQDAQQTAADAIKATPAPPGRQLPPASTPIVAGPVSAPPDTSGPIPTDPVTGRPLDRVPPQEALPVSRQLPAASAPPITAGPITPREDIGNPPVPKVDTSGLIPTDQVTGRPLDRTYPVEGAQSPTPSANAPTASANGAANATTTAAGTPEMVSLDEIARGITGGKFADLSPQQQRMAQQVYDEIHTPAHVALPAQPEPSSATSPQPASSAYRGGGNADTQPSGATPEPGNQETGANASAAGERETSQAQPSKLPAGVTIESELYPDGHGINVEARDADGNRVGRATFFGPNPKSSEPMDTETVGDIPQGHLYPAQVAVNPESQRQGIGTALYDEAAREWEKSTGKAPQFLPGDGRTEAGQAFRQTYDARSASANPAPASRVVNVPASAEFAPSKLMSEEGLTKYANDNGVTEDEARKMLEGDGYQIAGRSQLNRALHAVGTELDMDHDTLSDVAKIQFRVKSMKQLSQEDMLQFLEDLNNRRAVNNPMLGKGELADKFAGQSETNRKVIGNQTEEFPNPSAPAPTPAPGSTTKRPASFGDQLRESAEAALARRSPQAVAPAQALKTALETPTEAAPASGTPRTFPLINVGDTVQLRTGRYVKVKSVKPDGTFTY
jgi:GNAT superfamily N-acetyltransferase